MRRRILIRVLLSVAVCAGLGHTSMGETRVGTANSRAPANVVKGFGCLVAQPWVRDKILNLGLHVGESANVIFRTGTIPGTSPESPDVTNVLVLSANKKDGWVLFFRQNTNGTIIVIRNAYRVQREGANWTASDGNGGIGTYKAVGAFARELLEGPSVSITVAPTQGCYVEP